MKNENTHQEGDHGESAVLDLCFPQLGCAVAVVGGQCQGIESASWVYSLLSVQLSVAVDLCASYQDGLDPDQLSDGEGEGEAQVLGAVCKGARFSGLDKKRANVQATVEPIMYGMH